MNTILVSVGVIIILVILVIVVSQMRRQQLDTAWRQFASEIGAEFIEGGLFRSSKVQAQFKNWMIVLDTYSVSSGDSSETYTRIKTSIQDKDGFWFTIFRTGLVAKLDKALGAQDIEIGDAEFDGAFTVRSNNESKVRALFSNLKIRQMIQMQKSITIAIRKNELRLETRGVIKDVERLKSLFELFKETLNQLEG
ncbi:MAG TPA: hypothetical protein VIN60_10335 [Anaerolineales bacterium]